MRKAKVSEVMNISGISNFVNQLKDKILQEQILFYMQHSGSFVVQVGYPETCMIGNVAYICTKTVRIKVFFKST